jgi:hypothetical protein
VHTADELGLLLRQLPQLIEKQLDAAAQAHTSGQSTRPIRLVVIDSIAAPYRSETGIGAASNRRTLELLSHGARLKKLATAGGRENSLAVVLTNQVTAVMTTDAQELLQVQPTPPMADVGSHGTTSLPQVYAIRAPRPGKGGWPSAVHSWPYGSLGKGAGVGSVPSLGLSWGGTANTRVLLTKSRRPAGFTTARGAAAPKPLAGLEVFPSILSEFSVSSGGSLSSKRYLYVLNSSTVPMHGCEYALTSGGVTGIGE